MDSNNNIPIYVFRDIVGTDILSPISTEVVNHIISNPPFVPIPGLFNFRDLSHPLITPPLLRQNYIFRSGMLSFLEEEGKVKLTAGLGVKKIFDLRSAPELVKFPSPEIEGVEVRWLPTVPEAKHFHVADYDVGDAGAVMTRMYQNILVSHVPIYTSVFEHIRDLPEEPFFFHCTAGKDRTGVLAALILHIAGCSPDIIAEDYVLTRVGFEPVREVLLKSLLDGTENVDESVKRALAVVGGVPYEAMVQFLVFLEREFERGAEGYLRTKLGFSVEDIERIRQNLRA
ncbi:hypothetical protein PAAG_07459 [Paracoccidioides lutzii Pb01]|uniref:Tyrosine specific protein phosphatases domain-containing protein n=1 Tax=Paracoccidioides lutzii (strain ATCC MYA-826 / Pb01) TaxID=502779 RepID=C1H9L8_PARBA|nr:hypothetical protein PAAG_07459 [Paracoccidioides lutzii Pb01]EEH37041.1 hypothetical protein PAAG_07459 [Paracoccidioides lutzii Pb01]